MQLEEFVQSPPFELIDIVVRAGAGAGKTTELTQRVLKLAENFFAKHQRYPHFIVTTFTRKATQELKERLLKEAMKREDSGLTHFVKRPSQLQISTIHGILSLYLSRFGSVMGLSPKLTVVSESREKFQLKKKIRELCIEDAQFNEDFQSLIENSEFSDILEAFRESFQLRMRFGEISFFGEHEFSEIRSRKSAEVAQTIHQLCLEIRAQDCPEAWQELAAYGERWLPELKKEFSFSNWERFIDDLPAPRKTKAVPESVAELRDSMKDALEFFSSWRVSDDFCQSHTDFCGRFNRCAERMAAELRDIKLFSGEITMQDLETLSLMLIRQYPETAEAFSKQWDYWLVDEYQDTSPAQVELIKALSSTSKIFVVGDPQQSIYLFRGARSEVFSAREQEVEAAKGVLFSKLTNYRSEPELLEFFNFLFTNLSPQFQKMIPRSPIEQKSGKVVAEILQVSSDKEQEQDAEFEAILYRCQELMKQNVPLEKICVLSRNNRDLEELAWLAQKHMIPVQVHAAGQFFERREILDALGLLKFLCNPHDNKNLLQILRSPVFRVSDQVLYEWCQEVGTSFWLGFTRKNNEVIQKLQKFYLQAQVEGIGQVWRQILVNEGYFKFAHALDSSGRREANLWKLIQMVRTEERRPGFSYLEFLKSLDVRALSTEEPDEADAVPVIEPQKVHLMTIHASKGLQFGHVILPRMGKTSPSQSTEFFLHDEMTGRWTISLQDPDEGKKVASLSGIALLETMRQRQKQEEDRVLYVALTRAQESVTLIWQDSPKKDSWATRIKLKLEEGLHEESLFHYQVRKGRFAPEMGVAPTALELKEVLAFDSGATPDVQAFSVTEILEKKNVGLSSELPDLQKAITGVDVHRIFESLKYKWMKNPRFQWQEMLPELTAQHQKALNYMAQDQNGLWLDVIQNGEVEYGMAVQFDGKLIQGQIDLWGVDSQGRTWIVDYKTGSPSYREKAFYQLQIYTWALQKIGKIPLETKVNLAVIYPFSDMTLIREAPPLSEIEKEIRAVRDEV